MPMPPRPEVDTVTAASLPGRIQVDWLVWGRCFPGETVPRLLRLALVTAIPVAFLIAAPGDAWGLAAFFLILIAAQFIALRRVALDVRNQLQHGCLNAAQVVSVSPYQIAVYGDLTQSGGEYWPVIKILPQPLEKCPGRRMREGDRLPTVSYYYGYHGKPYWDDFKPIAVPCVTGDARAVRDALERINRREDGETWAGLEAGLALVPKPYKPGLYWMRQR